MKKLAIAILLLIASFYSYATPFTLLLNASAPVTGSLQTVACSPNRTHSAVLYGTSAISATVTIQGSNDGVNAWKDIAYFTLSAASPEGTCTTSAGKDCDGASNGACWIYERAILKTISGAGATVDVKGNN